MPQCAAITKAGKRCGNGAMRGSPFCGPHTDHPPARVAESADEVSDRTAAPSTVAQRQATTEDLRRDDWVVAHPKYANPTCVDCGAAVDVGEMAYWNPSTKAWLHTRCFLRRSGGEPIDARPDERPDRFQRMEHDRRKWR